MGVKKGDFGAENRKYL